MPEYKNTYVLCNLLVSLYYLSVATEKTGPVKNYFRTIKILKSWQEEKKHHVRN